MTGANGIRLGRLIQQEAPGGSQRWAGHERHQAHCVRYSNACGPGHDRFGIHGVASLVAMRYCRWAARGETWMNDLGCSRLEVAFENIACVARSESPILVIL